jgi:hypothetical protein
MGKVPATLKGKGKGKAKVKVVLTPGSYKAPGLRRTPGLKTTPSKVGKTKYLCRGCGNRFKKMYRTY